MSSHRLYIPDAAFVPGTIIAVQGDEAHHAARVKRLEAGAHVEVCNGRGDIASASISRIGKQGRSAWELTVAIAGVRCEPPTSPALSVWSAVPKGDRLENLVDALSQVGAAEWAPLAAARSVVEPREGKLHRLERCTTEAMKQCGRAWRMRIGIGGEFPAALGDSVIIADASGGRYEATGDGALRLLIGPEGGWTPQELALGASRGARMVSFGIHTMRIETAACAAAAIILDAEGRVIR